MAEAAAPARTAFIAGGAWVAAFAMLQWSVVRFEVPIVLTLTGCAALLGFSLAQRRGYAGPVPTAVVVAVLLSSALVTWRVPLFTYVPAGPRTAILVTIALAAVLTSLLLARPTRPRCVTAYGIAVLTHVAVAAQAIIADPTPRIDVWHLLNEGADVLKDGGNIYTATWPQSPGVKDAFTYLPWTLVLLAPGRWFAGDARWMLLIWSLVLLLALALLASGRPHAWWRAGVAAAALAVVPGSLTQVDQAWTEPLLAALLGLWAALVARGRAWWAVIPLALACASKQHLVLLVPLFLLWSRFGWKRTLATGALSAALIAPFALADLPAFVHDTITLLLGFHPIRFANTWYLLALNVYGWTPPFWLTTLVMGLVVLLAALVVARRQPAPSELLTWCAFVLLVANLVNKQAFYNQFWLSGALLALAFAASSLTPSHSPEGPPEPASAR